MYSIDLTGKTGLVMGVANQRSLAWAIAQPLAQAGARLAFSYQAERLRPALDKLTEDLKDPLLLECDVGDDAALDRMFAAVGEEFGKLDYLVHALAFAPANTFSNPFVETSRQDWQTAMDVSAYSLVASTKRAAELMGPGGSVVTLSYLAAERVVPHYNMMGVAKAALEASVRYLGYDLGPRGIRVNAISAGAVRTIAARSIAGFGDLYTQAGEMSMLKRNITHEEVGGLGLSLLVEQLGGGITGETVYVDAGFHAIGLFVPPNLQDQY
ncbi:MAG TPA: enoyl-ACP reductase [Trueperaceae bacterium]|nr:enoyl-ACP reductase [Trueperaceae bacterium]HRP46080.1 enoyl-ACP reductase [Trueperaceae bacterium]